MALFLFLFLLLVHQVDAFSFQSPVGSRFTMQSLSGNQEAEVAVVNATVEGVKSDVLSVKNSVDEVQTQVKDVFKKLDKLEEMKNSQSKSISSVQNQMKTVQEAVETKFSTLNTTLNSMKETMKGFKEVSSVQNQMKTVQAAVETKLSTLNTTLNSVKETMKGFKQVLESKQKEPAKSGTSKDFPCGPPPNYQNAHLTSLPAEGTSQVASYSCDPGFRSCSSRTSRCLPTGKWDKAVIQCDQSVWIKPEACSRDGCGSKPFKVPTPCGGSKNLTLLVEGTCLGKRLMIFNIKSGDNYLFHLSARHDLESKPVNVYNAFIDGKWGHEERDTYLFTPNQQFKLEISLEAGSFTVKVDGKVQHVMQERLEGAIPTHVSVQDDVFVHTLEIL